MMNLQQELDALIESTMAFVNDVKRRKPIPDLPVALRTAEQALADISKPITAPATVAPMVLRRQRAMKSGSASAISKRIRKKWRGSARTIICKSKPGCWRPAEPALVHPKRNPPA
jgi:hypothetical protein